MGKENLKIPINPLSRRDFLRMAALGTLAVPLVACKDVEDYLTTITQTPSPKIPVSVTPSPFQPQPETATEQPTVTVEPSITPESTTTSEPDVQNTATTETLGSHITRYENMSQREFADIAAGSRRLYQKGKGRTIPLGFDEPGLIREEMFPGMYTVSTYGILLEKPQLETFVLPHWDISSSDFLTYNLYTAPVLYQVMNGNYFVTRVVFAGPGTRSSRAFYYTQEVISNLANNATPIATDDLMQIVQVNVQHEIRLGYSFSPEVWIRRMEESTPSDLTKSWSSLSRQYAQITHNLAESFLQGNSPRGIQTIAQCQEIFLNQEKQ